MWWEQSNQRSQFGPRCSQKDVRPSDESQHRPAIRHLQFRRNCECWWLGWISCSYHTSIWFSGDAFCASWCVAISLDSQTEKDLDTVVQDWKRHFNKHIHVITTWKIDGESPKPYLSTTWGRQGFMKIFLRIEVQNERNLERMNRILQPLYQITEYLWWNGFTCRAQARNSIVS